MCNDTVHKSQLHSILWLPQYAIRCIFPQEFNMKWQMVVDAVGLDSDTVPVAVITPDLCLGLKL